MPAGDAVKVGVGVKVVPKNPVYRGMPVGFVARARNQRVKKNAASMVSAIRARKKPMMA